MMNHIPVQKAASAFIRMPHLCIAALDLTVPPGAVGVTVPPEAVGEPWELVTESVGWDNVVAVGVAGAMPEVSPVS